MTGPLALPGGGIALLVALAGAPYVSAQSDRAPSGLRILVIGGENAVNVVQQKSAVAPVVEVRDRNDQPVSGVVVRFAIRNGRATFSGARALSVTTNAAGRAVATGLTPTGSGALQIGASAAFQGQTATVTIAQTNVMTTAQATAAAGGSASTGSASGTVGGAAGGGSGGGLSATTLGIVGGAAAGGTIAVKEVLGGPTHIGTFSGPFVETYGTCVINDALTGTLEMDIDVAGDGTVTGTSRAKGSWDRLSASAACGGDIPLVQFRFDYEADVRGLASALAITWSRSHPQDDGSTHTITVTFTGAVVSNVVTGTMTVLDERTLPNTPTLAGSGTGSYPVTAAAQK